MAEPAVISASRHDPDMIELDAGVVCICKCTVLLSCTCFCTAGWFANKQLLLASSSAAAVSNRDVPSRLTPVDTLCDIYLINISDLRAEADVWYFVAY
jgi:hypothetical protein